MAYFNIKLETHDGSVEATASDPIDFLSKRVIPNHAIFPVLSQIDEYGDTIFNQKQVALALKEIEIAKRWAVTAEEQIVSQAIFDIFSRCLIGVHRFVKFYGD